MKHIFFLIGFCLALNTLRAQQPGIPKEKSENQLQLKIPDSKTGNNITRRVLETGATPNAKFLYNTEKGKVYALPQDKMPCLVPPINSNMPVASLNISGYKSIPNALPLQKVIPGTEILVTPLDRK